LEKQTQFCVCLVALCSQYGAFKNRKDVNFKPVFVPILTGGNESWVMNETIKSQVQAAETGFLRNVHGVTVCDKRRSCEIRKEC